MMGLGHSQIWASITCIFKSTSNWVPPCPAWFAQNGVGAAGLELLSRPWLGRRGILCCKTLSAPAEGSRHQGKKPSRESASHEKEVLKTAWKQPGSAATGSSRAGSSGDRQVSFSIYLSIRLSIHPSIYWRSCPQELTPVSCLVADGEEHTLRSTKQAQIERVLGSECEAGEKWELRGISEAVRL